MCTNSKQLTGWTLGLIQKKQGETSNKVMAAALKKGGAEGWVQVELDRIYETLPNTAWVQREQPIFEGAEKVDFLIKCKDGPEACLELKVESMFQSADLGRSFIPHRQWSLVEKDVQKLQTERNADYARAPAYVVVILWSPEAIEGLDQWLRATGLTFERERYEALHQDIRWPVTIYVITITGD
jgi:hypothetical protein